MARSWQGSRRRYVALLPLAPILLLRQNTLVVRLCTGGKDGDGYEALERKHWELYNQPQSAREWVDSRHEREEGLVLLHQSVRLLCSSLRYS